MKSIVELWTPVLLNGGIFKDDYLVSNMGRMKQKRTYKNGSYTFVLMKIINSKRPLVKLFGDGHEYRKSLAKLVLSSFQYREGCECANITYLDGNMKNCALSNLRYAADKAVYEEVSKPTPQEKRRMGVRRPSSDSKSCKTCVNYPCFDGMASLTSDFGAEGCKGYKFKKTS